MQSKKAARLQAKKDPNTTCTHPEITKEYYLSMATGDYVCTTCGEAGWGRDWRETEAAQAAAARTETP